MKKIYEIKYDAELNKGITLIALIVTIVTMLILAGVSLSIMLGNNGILNKATQAKKLYDVSAIKEALEMEKAEIAINQNRVDLDSYLEQITSGEKTYNLNSTDKIDDKNAEIIVNGEHKFLIKDKGNGDVEIIYQGIANIGGLALSSSSGTYTYPTSGTFSVINNSTGGALSVISESPDVATVSISGNTITVYPGTTAGKARIIVKSATVGEYAENRAIYMATVENGSITISATPYTGTYDGQEHNALTNVSTNPTGTTITYSTDGVNYSNTIPIIKDTSSFTVSVSASKEGYKTQTETYTVTVNKADGGLTLSEISGTYAYPESRQIMVTNNISGGTLSATSSNPAVATVSVSEGVINIKSENTAGNAIITVKSAATENYKEETITYTVTVLPYKIGDFVNYSAGTWDGDNGEEFKKIEESTGIMPNNSTALPRGKFQFGGFTSTSSKDGNATIDIFYGKYDYVKDKTTGKAVTGWRIFDVTDGKITLISVGCPEDFYHPAGGNSAYISEYILTGHINSSADASSLGLGTTYKVRDWSMYLTSEYKTTGTAAVLTKEKIDAWYTKYMGILNANISNLETYRKMYGTELESIIDNYSFYWIPLAKNDMLLFANAPDTRMNFGPGPFAGGIRVLLTLPSSVKLKNSNESTKTITSRGVDYAYNAWDIN